MKVQHSEPAVKQRFSTTSLTNKNSNQLYKNTEDPRTLDSATKARRIGHANCSSHVLEYNKHMGENVLRLRVLHNLSSKQFADRLGVSPQQLYRYENGLNKISGKVLSKVARIIYANIDSKTIKTLDKKIFLEMIIDYFNFKAAL